MSKSTPKNRQHKQVEVQLTEVFGGVLSPQVISSVAQNCGYNCKQVPNIIIYLQCIIYSYLKVCIINTRIDNR